MRVTTATVAAAVLLLTMAGCSDTGCAETTAPVDTPSASSDEVEVLTPLWEHDLVVPAMGSGGTGGVEAVSEGHLLATATVDNSAGMYNPTPNVQLDYGIADTETGEVVVMKPLGSSYPSTVLAVPDSDLFVAFSRDRIGVIDPARAAFVWTHRTIGEEIVSLSPTRIWMGRDNKRLQPTCLTVDTGAVVSDAACRDAEHTGTFDIDGIHLSEDSRPVDLMGDQLEVPVTSAWEKMPGELTEELWTYGNTSVRLEGGETVTETSTFAKSSLGLVRVDYRHTTSESDQIDPAPSPDAVLHLVDVRTGEVVRTLGRVDGGRFMGFAADVAVFEQPTGESGIKAVGYRVGS